MNKEWLDQAKIEASKFWKPLQGGTKHPVVTRKEKEKKERRRRLYESSQELYRRQHAPQNRRNLMNQNMDQVIVAFNRLRRPIIDYIIENSDCDDDVTITDFVNEKFNTRAKKIDVINRINPAFFITNDNGATWTTSTNPNMIEETLGLIFELIWDDENDSGNEGNGRKIGGMLPAGHQPPRRVAKIMPPYKLELSRRRQNFSNFLIDLRNIIPTLQWKNPEEEEAMLQACYNPAQVRNLFDELDDDNDTQGILTIDNFKNTHPHQYHQILEEMIEWIHDNLE